MGNTGIWESESMLWTFLVIFLGVEGVSRVLHNLHKSMSFLML